MGNGTAARAAAKAEAAANSKQQLLHKVFFLEFFDELGVCGGGIHPLAFKIVMATMANHVE